MRKAGALTLGLVCVVIACSGNDAEERLGEQAVGPEGGTITVDGVTLTIPPGALDRTTNIAVHAASEARLPADLRALRGPYRFEPTGLRFKRPIGVKFEGVSDDHAAIFWSVADAVQNFAPLDPSHAGPPYEAQVDHFSFGLLGFDSRSVDEVITNYCASNEYGRTGHKCCLGHCIEYGNYGRCLAGNCVLPCGAEGAICCNTELGPSDPTLASACRSDLQHPDQELGCSINNLCLHCGSGGEQCCPTRRCKTGSCNAANLCDRCGDVNEPCCTSGETCSTSKSLRCMSGLCKPASCGDGKCDAPAEDAFNCQSDCPCDGGDLCPSSGHCTLCNGQPKCLGNGSTCCGSLVCGATQQCMTCGGQFSCAPVGSTCCGAATCSADQVCLVCPGDPNGTCSSPSKQCEDAGVAGQCTTLDGSAAPVVTAAQHNFSTAPQQSGGTIVPGKYVLVTADMYWETTPPPNYQIGDGSGMAFLLSGSAFTQNETGASSYIYGGSYSFSGTTLTYWFACPALYAGTWAKYEYSASPTGFVRSHKGAFPAEDGGVYAWTSVQYFSKQ